MWVSRDPYESMLKEGAAASLIPTFMGGELEAIIPEYWPDMEKEWEISS